MKKKICLLFIILFLACNTSVNALPSSNALGSGVKNVFLYFLTPEAEGLTDQEKKDHFICVCELGQDMVFVQCARTRLLQIHQELANDTRISKMAWYYTENPFFNRFPNSSKARLLKINRMELIDNLKGATELECDGRILRQKRK